MVSFLNNTGFVRGVSELSQESKVGLFAKTVKKLHHRCFSGC